MKEDLRYGKIQPQAKDLEEAILGACMLEKDAYDKAAEILTADCFYTDANQLIFSAMASLAGRNMIVDLPMVVNQLKESNQLEKCGGVLAVAKLTNLVVSTANLENHCRIVLQKFIRREIIRNSSEILSEAFDETSDVFDLLDMAEEKIMQIGSNHINGDILTMDQVMNNAVSKIEEWRQNDSTLTGVPSGFPELDRASRGWQPGDFIVIGARPSIGKTAFALNLARNAALSPEKKTTVAIWSLEMKAVYLGLRLLAAESEIYLHKIQTGRLDDEAMRTLIKTGVNRLRQASIFFDDNTNMSLRVLRSKARKLKKKNNLGLIIVDYIQLMSGDENKGNREQEIARISRGLKNLAQELEIPIIALSQLSRESDRGVGWEKAPAVSSLRESGAIEQDADVILLLWGPTDEDIKGNIELDGKRKIKIGKQRNGMLLTMELDFKNEIQLFKAIDEIQKPFDFKGNFRPVSSQESSEAKLFIQKGSKMGCDDEAPF